MSKILIAEDDKSINDLIAMNLRLAGYEYKQVYDGMCAKEISKKESFDLILLDVMLPGVDGFTLMDQKLLGEIPVIFVTAKLSVVDRVKGLKLGADDYITKPFESVELLARVEAVLRRTAKEAEFVKIGNTKVYIDQRVVMVGEKEVTLTNREFELLLLLIENKNIALSREKILEHAWGYEYLGDTRTVDVHITKLRKKLHLEDYIKTVFKLGYRLEV